MRQSSPLLRLFPILLLNLTAFAIAIPVLPALAIDLGATAVDVGLLYALQSFGQFVMAPIWGNLSDRFGRKRILVATMAAAAITEFLTAFTPTLWLLYFSRFVVGLCAGNVATATALIADSTTPQTRSKGMAIVGISFGIGFTLGPALGAGVGFFAHDGAGFFGSGLPFAAAALLNIITMFLALIFLVETTENAVMRRQNRLATRPRSIAQHLRNNTVRSMCVLFLLYTVSVTVMEGTFFVYMAHVYDYDIRQVGLLFAMMGLLMALAQGSVGQVSRKLGDRRMVGLGISLLAIGLFFAPWIENVIILIVFLGVATLGRAYIHPGILSMTSQASEDGQNTGQIMGILQSSSSLGRIFGPAIGGLLFAFIHHSAPFWIAALMILGTGLWWWKNTTPNSSDT